MNQTEVSRSYSTETGTSISIEAKGSCTKDQARSKIVMLRKDMLFSYQHDMKIDLMLQWKALTQYPLHQECHCRYAAKRFCPLHRHTYTTMGTIKQIKTILGVCYYAIIESLCSPIVPPSSMTQTSGGPSLPSTGFIATRSIQSCISSVICGTTW